MTIHRKKAKSGRRAVAKPVGTALAVVKKGQLDRAIDGVMRKMRAIMPSKYVAELVPTPPSDDLNMLGEDATLGALGLTEVKLTAEEEAILSRAVNPSDILIKPSGQPYIPHPVYTKWFNDAFGRLGWSIVPKSRPKTDGKSVTCPYILFIHGQPAAFAYGEQDYFDANKEQTYGDAIEATVASALRRCAKRLGVGLELWNKEFLDAWIAERCVMVQCTGRPKPQYRLKTARPFWDEIGPWGTDRRGGGEVIDTSRVPPAGRNAGAVITEPQLRRLWAIMGKARRDEAEVKGWLAVRYGLDHMRDIPRSLYDEVSNWIEQPGPLPAKER